MELEKEHLATGKQQKIEFDEKEYELLRKISRNELLSGKEQLVFTAFQNKLSNVIRRACKTVLQKGGTQFLLTGPYTKVKNSSGRIEYETTALDDLESNTWLSFLKALQGEKQSQGTPLLENITGYITKIAYSQANKFSGYIIRKHEHGVDPKVNTIFDGIDDKENFDESSLPSKPSTEDLNIGPLTIDHFLNSLKDNQKEIMSLHLQGHTKTDIAKKLNVTVKTIYNQMKTIDQKASKMQ